MKKDDGELCLPLIRTKDILQHLGAHKREGQCVVGFSMETENLIAHSQEKLMRKNVDMICANTVASGNTGFGVDTNQVTIIMPDGVKELPLCSKDETASLILDTIMENK